MKRIILTALLALLPLIWILGPPKAPEHVEPEPVTIEQKIEEPIVEPTKEEVKELPAEKPVDIVKENPKDCTQATQWILPDGTCKDKEIAQKATTEAPVASSSGSGSCHAEIKKYSWPIGIATNVMMAESGGNTNALNNNPATGDYSVGCFQVNLYGANARNRPSEAALKNASTNVAWAYNNYVANGHSFIGQWGVCRSISCI